MAILLTKQTKTTAKVILEIEIDCTEEEKIEDVLKGYFSSHTSKRKVVSLSLVDNYSAPVHFELPVTQEEVEILKKTKKSK